MSVLRVGTSEKYASNWAKAFGEKKKKAPSTGTKTTTRKKAARKKARK